MLSAEPELVKYQFALTSTPPLLVVKDHFCWIFREVSPAQQAEFIQLVPAGIGSPKHSVRSASGWTTPTHAAPRVPFRQRRITAAGLPPEPAPHMLHPSQPCETPAPAAPAPPPRPACTHANARGRSASRQSGAQTTPCRCGLPPPCLCSLPLSRAALRASRSPPPASSSLHQG